ncbi:SUMO-activating enzyme subunit 1 isoform X6 [Mustela erminea]|uniref:SUMO-activating enzyme subunit 1 isoform X6 n=1 Tax=Mustela erminea TaxID=36723 RepID=UPI001386D51B|nr:SUMO-activating enzyme subunit 1 isoform X6 [Mustela erminea]
MVEKEEAGGGISEEEAAQYDRQIRLWGLEAQKRLRASRVLLVGMKGLGAEIAKNLILAGVKGLTMLDPEQVCLTCCSRDVIIKVDQICHKNSIKFFTGDVFGYHGYTFANLGEHEFVEEKTKVAKVSQGVEDGPDTKRAKLDSSETTMVKKKVVFCSVKDALEVDWRSDKAKAALKRTTSDYFLLQVLLKFRTDKGRDPSSDTFGEDSELLLQIRNDVLDSLGVSPDLLPEDFVRCSLCRLSAETTFHCPGPCALRRFRCPHIMGLFAANTQINSLTGASMSHCGIAGNLLNHYVGGCLSYRYFVTIINIHNLYM